LKDAVSLNAGGAATAGGWYFGPTVQLAVSIAPASSMSQTRRQFEKSDAQIM
jgi:hypothetical protein